MSFVTSHPNLVYVGFAFIELTALVVIAGSLVSIAITLRSKKDK